MPALLTSTSTRPSSRTVSSTTRVQSSGTPTSAGIATQRRPSVAHALGGLLQAFGAAGADGDVGAGFGEAGGKGGAEPRGGAGDDGDLAVEPEAVDD